MLTQTEILERAGWTRTLVKSLLGPPDQTKKGQGDSVITFYDPNRVEEAERSEPFKAAQDRIQTRRAAARKTVATKRTATMEAARTMTIEVEVVPDPTAAAIADYNSRERNLTNPCSKSSDPAFLELITVNYIRHNLTQYDQALYDLFDKTGKVMAAFAIKWRVLEAIGKAYPQFESECWRQINNTTLRF